MAARPSSEARDTKGLDFFAHTEEACQDVFKHLQTSFGETACQSLQRSILRSVGLVHDLPLMTLNDRLKKYHFVDPKPLDDHLSEMIRAVLAWLVWVTNPYWIVDVLHRIGSLSPEGKAWLAERVHLDENKQVASPSSLSPVATMSLQRGTGHEQGSALIEIGSTKADLELEQMGRFTFPMPLKLRDLQAMVHPFMETRSTHHIEGLDSMVAELIRSLLHLFQLVKAWDDSLVGLVERVTEAECVGDTQSRSMALLELCAMLEMDVFEAAHRLNRVDNTIFELTPGEIEMICQKLPLYQDQRILRGPPSAALDHGLQGAYGEAQTRANVRKDSFAPDHQEETPLEAVRSECLHWWRSRRFVHAAPSRIFANALLTHLVDVNLHPDPYVTEMLPRVLERLFGNQLSCRCFMNRLLPSLGGYVDGSGAEVAPGEGLTPVSRPARCAETLLVFLRRWSDLVLGAEEEDAARATRTKQIKSALTHRRIDMLDRLMEQLDDTGRADGHTLRSYYNEQDVSDLLEGTSVVDATFPGTGARYKIHDMMVRSWELLSDHYHDHTEQLMASERDLGPYLHLDLDRPEELGRFLGGMPEGSWTIVNPEVAAAAAHAFCLEDKGKELPPELQKRYDASNTFALRLVDWPADLNPEGGGSSSTFVNFFAQDGRRISRLGMHGLPLLPWSFGRDERNTIIMDVMHRESIAPFHVLFARSDTQLKRAVAISLGDPMSSSYIVCPKYQPLQVRNGDRIFCHQWSCEVRLSKSGHHTNNLSLIMDEGDIFEVPLTGCHVGAGNRSRKLEHQPFFPETKLALRHRVRDMASVHIVFQYQQAMNRWTLIDHSPDPQGALLLMKPGVAYALSDGMRLKLGPLVLEVASEKV